MGIKSERRTDGLYLAPSDFDRLRAFDERSARTRGTTIFDWKARSAKARQWVGVIEVAGVSLEILPKIADDISFARRNLLYMLGVAGHVPVRERDLAGQSLERLPLIEALIRIFVDRLLSEIHLGLLHGYVGRTENLPLLKGKLVLSKHLKVNLNRPDRFHVEFDEFSADNVTNRILKACCTKLARPERHPKTLEQLRHVLALMDDVADVQVTDADFQRITFNRRNNRFEPLIGFAKLVLCGDAPTSAGGKASTFSLVFDMNAVFEAFISEFMRRYVLSTDDIDGWSLRVQGRGQRTYLAYRHPDARGVTRLKPDIRLHKGHRNFIIDTKWKTLTDQGDSRRGVSKADMLQLFAYAHHYDCRDVMLLYPSTSGAVEASFDLPPVSNVDRSIHVRFVDLSRDLKASRGALAAEMSAFLTPFLSP